MNSPTKVLFFIGALLIPEIVGYDEVIQISDLAGCREIRLTGRNDNELKFPISSFLNNQKKFGEILRMKFYAIGYDFNVYLRYAETAYQLYANFNGLPKRTCYLKHTSYDRPLHSVDCANRTNSFDYSEFTLVIGTSRFFFFNFWNSFYLILIFTDKDIEFYEGKDIEPFLFANSGNANSVSYLSFGRNLEESVDTRLFFDCPNKY